MDSSVGFAYRDLGKEGGEEAGKIEGKKKRYCEVFPCFRLPGRA